LLINRTISSDFLWFIQFLTGHTINIVSRGNSQAEVHLDNPHKSALNDQKCYIFETMILRNRQRENWFIWIVLWLLALNFRWVYPLADPPIDLSWSGGYFADEGFWTHDARNLILTGSYGDDEWHDRLVAPLVHPFMYGLFRCLTPSLTAVRVWAAGISLTALILFAAVLRKYRWGTLAFLLACICSLLVAYQRLALLETAALAGCAATIFFWERSRRLGTGWWDLAAGVCAALTFLTKSTQIHFLAAILIATIFDGPSRKNIHRVMKQILGLSIVLLVWYFAVRLPNARLLDQYQAFYFSQQGRSIPELINNVLIQPFFIYFNRMPLIFITAWAVILERVLFFRRRQCPPVVDVCIVWLTSGLVFFAPFGYRPLRYYLPLILPMVIIAAWRIHTLMISSQSEASAIADLSLPCRILLAIWILVPGCINIIPVLDRLIFKGNLLGFSNIPGFSLEGSILSVMTSILLMTGLTVNRKGYRSKQVIIVLMVFLSIHVVRMVYWQNTRTYQVISTSREIGRILPEDAVIAGQWAPELCLENSCTAIPMWDGFVNFKRPFDRYGITHVLSWQYPLGDELTLQRSWFPGQMATARAIRVFTIKDSPVVLWEIKRQE
jgi:4-amino-4-deoxy-L-arabinose transferase-like glycosyltransferase